ncbi:MAG: serine--tRNA ligase, partial [Ruthenibacterium lactatiformans]
MLDIKFVRENPELVKENIKKKFQDSKLLLVDEVIALDAEYRAAITEGDGLRAQRNKLSKSIGALMAQGKKDEAEAVKKQVTEQADRLKELEMREAELQEEVRQRMLVIPNMLDPSVPIGRDDSENVEVQRFGEPVVPDFEIPYHTEIMERFGGIDLDSARRVAGNGFYYLLGDIARLHEAVLAYARDFMIEKGFTYVIPPFMMHGSVVQGVMSFPEMDAMMYKIEGEDLYLIGTSEHTMIGRFVDQLIPEAQLPLTLTSYSPASARKKALTAWRSAAFTVSTSLKKQEMIVLCKPEDSMAWYETVAQQCGAVPQPGYPVRQLECCSGDLADLKVKSCDIEAWSPRQQKYFEVCSCSNLGDAQSRRLKIRIKGEDGKNYLPHTLNNTCVAPPRMLIAFLENNLRADGSVRIPEVLR